MQILHQIAKRLSIMINEFNFCIWKCLLLQICSIHIYIWDADADEYYNMQQKGEIVQLNLYEEHGEWEIVSSSASIVNGEAVYTVSLYQTWVKL